jgi:ribosome recycling factor
MADSIMIKVPTMTEERRKDISKVAKTMAEDAKV